MQRIGIGYDVHRLVKGRKLVLGGIEIPHETGLDGHSDADVLLHAVCDAILGALAKGDIGEHFPVGDPKFKDISSLKLLKIVNDMTAQEGYKVHNVDAVVIAERPSLKDHKKAMAANIARELDIPKTSANVKATTNESIGFVGRKEGIAAYAVVLLVKK